MRVRPGRVATQQILFLYQAQNRRKQIISSHAESTLNSVKIVIVVPHYKRVNKRKPTSRGYFSIIFSRQLSGNI